MSRSKDDRNPKFYHCTTHGVTYPECNVCSRKEIKRLQDKLDAMEKPALLHKPESKFKRMLFNIIFTGPNLPWGHG